MLQHWILREPTVAFGLPVCALAALIFPLYLGWAGTPVLAFVGYLVVAAGLFSLADALLRPSDYSDWASVTSQAILSLLTLAVPATLMFGIGAIVGPVDEAMDEEVCASRGTAEADTPEAEADDALDLTPDCAVTA